MTAKTTQTDDWNAVRADINSRLEQLLVAGNGPHQVVRRALRESVVGPGKRIRAMLVQLAVLDMGSASPAAIDAGCALEMVHSASLLLDDLPCMDDAQMRRGKPAIHLSFGEDIAILASIALLGEAFALVASLPGIGDGPRNRMNAALAEAIGVAGLVGGQYSDLRQSEDYDDAAATDANDRKTGALFVAALVMAGELCGVSGQAGTLRSAGVELGRAFQLYDDLLDVSGDPRKMGKDVSKDQGKTLLAQLLGQDAVMARIETHVERARALFASLPGGGKRLQLFLDHIFGSLAPAHPQLAAEGLMSRQLG